MPYCVRCKKQTRGINGSVHQSTNNRLRIASQCKKCGGNQSVFISPPKPIKGKGIDFVNFLNNNPLTKDVEFHLPLLGDHGFTKASYLGPNTNLDKRISNLNE